MVMQGIVKGVDVQLGTIEDHVRSLVRQRHIGAEDENTQLRVDSEKDERNMKNIED